MIKPGRFRIATLLACVAAALGASAQSPMANTQSPITDHSGNTGSSGEVVPSDAALGEGLSSEIGKVTSRAGGHKTGYSISTAARDIRSSLATDAVPGEVSGLCFQQGVGWQRVPIVSFKPVHAMGSVTAGGPEKIYQQLSGAKPTASSQCLGMLANASAPGGGVEGLMAAKMAHSGNSPQVASTNAGTQDWLHANSVINPANSVSAQRLTVGLPSSSFTSKHYAQEADSDVSRDQVREIARHAYISPIKLRRMMRNVPDLQTRIALRESSDKLANRKKHSGTDSWTARKATEEHSEDRHGNKDQPISVSQVELYRTKSGGTSQQHTYR